MRAQTFLPRVRVRLREAERDWKGKEEGRKVTQGSLVTLIQDNVGSSLGGSQKITEGRTKEGGSKRFFRDHWGKTPGSLWSETGLAGEPRSLPKKEKKLSYSEAHAQCIRGMFRSQPRQVLRQPPRLKKRMEGKTPGGLEKKARRNGETSCQGSETWGNLRL